MILVPRPAPHLPHTLAELKTAGFTTLISLALTKPQSLPITLPGNTEALLLTSPLGVHPDLPKTLPAYCVGPATAVIARRQGLNVVYTGTHNGVTMARDIFELHLPQTRFTHLHGDHAGMDWHTILELAGHMVTPVPAYKTRRIATLPNKIRDQINSHPPQITLLFSAGSATHLANLMKHANIQPTGTAIAFSPAVAGAAASHWPTVLTAARTTLESLIAIIPPQG